MTLHGLPLFVRLAGRPVILLGAGEAANAKRRLLERAGAMVVDEAGDAALAIVAIDDDAEADAAVRRLKARGVLVNAVDRPALCDFTLPAIVERDPVLVAIGTGGVSAGLAAALRQRLEAMLPTGLGELAIALHAARDQLRDAYPDPIERRRSLAGALAAGGELDTFGSDPDLGAWLGSDKRDEPMRALIPIRLASADPDDLTLRQARLLANADHLFHRADVSAAILNRARADAARIVVDAAPVDLPPGLSVWMEMA